MNCMPPALWLRGSKSVLPALQQSQVLQESPNQSTILKEVPKLGWEDMCLLQTEMLLERPDVGYWRVTVPGFALWPQEPGRRHRQREELGATVLRGVDGVGEHVHVNVRSYMCTGDVFN